MHGAADALEAVVHLGVGALHARSPQPGVVECVLIATLKAGFLNNGRPILWEAETIACIAYITTKERLLKGMQTVGADCGCP